MKHYDEYTLEMYLLGSEKVADRRDEIELHLKGCYSCRELTEELHQFHAAANGSKPLLDEHVETADRASLELRPEYVQLKSHTLPVWVVRSLPSQLWHAATRRPLVATFSGIALVVLAVAVFYTRTPSKDTNPLYYRLNESQEALEVFNQRDDRLWQLPLDNVKEIKQEEARMRSHRILIADLDGDGRNEVITTLHLPSEGDAGRPLKVFDGDKNIDQTKASEIVAVNFRGTLYEAPYGYESILVESIIPAGPKNIFVAANNARSPWFLARLDSKLYPIGRYWHFGGIYGLYFVEMGEDGRKKIVLCGENQVNESEDGSTSSFAAILDPSKVEGDLEASATRGFGMVTSGAELFYIRFPESDINKLLSRRPKVSLISTKDEKNLRFYFVTNDPLREPQFEFIFSRDMHLLEVKTTSGTIGQYAELKKQGKVKGTLDQRYLENLGRKLLYWDGTKWSNEWTKVHPPTMTQ